MAQRFNGYPKTVKEIHDDFTKGKLIVDASYQRRKVWLEQDNVRLIETILLDLVIPEVFFWPASIDSDTGDMVTHIVDGQQRVAAVVAFIKDEFRLTTKHLIEQVLKERCANKLFSELSKPDKEKIWTYKLSIVEIDSTLKKADIVRMFKRLNLTNYSLNSSEKRHAKGGKFNDAAIKLADYDFWEHFKVFSASDSRRMKDIEYCCSIFILANEGIIDQTTDEKIVHYYDDYANEFDKDKKLLTKINSAISIIEKLEDKMTLQFLSKKAQMYTIFCFVFRLIDIEIPYSEEIFEIFKLFVITYNLFRNEYEFSFNDKETAKLHENIKKYKLASSEGINKLKNRMIRYEVMYKICIENTSTIRDHLCKLVEKYETKNRKKDTERENPDNDDFDIG
jgi:hypothetical protein